MLRREPILPPEDIYPIHDWRLVEGRLNLKAIAQSETIFATANGYLGMRGAFEEGSPASQHGTFINGFYESWPIPYGESAFGFAMHGQTIVNVPDGKIIRLYIDDEPFDLESAFVQRYERALDMQNGTLDPSYPALTVAGGQVTVLNCTLLTTGDAPTILVSGGNLTLRNDIIQESTGFNDAAISVTGGITFEALQENFRVQARGLLDGGAENPAIWLNPERPTLEIR